MKLLELNPQCVKYVVTPGWPTQIANDPTHFPEGGSHIEFRDQISYHHVDSLAEAQGIVFLCPTCFKTNGGSMGTHSVLCWSSSRGTPANATPLPGRWNLAGTGYEDLTLNSETGGNRSVLLTGPGCGAHFYVTNGEVTPA